MKITTINPNPILVFNHCIGDSPILKVLSSTNALAKNQIGVWLQANDPPAKGSPRRNAAGGEITFGGANAARYKEPITYVNCVGDAPWMVTLMISWLLFEKAWGILHIHAYLLTKLHLWCSLFI
jgi:hypothetical protein